MKLFRFDENYREQGVYHKYSRAFFRSGDWSELSYSAKAILPVMVGHLNKRHADINPSQYRIAAYSNKDVKTVRNALRKLEKKGILVTTSDSSIASGFRHHWYRINPAIAGNSLENDYFCFYKSILDSGLWFRLGDVSRAIYITMLSYGDFNRTCLQNDSSKEAKRLWNIMESEGRDSAYAKRDFEYCIAEKEIICSCANVSTKSNSFNTAIKELTDSGLIRSMDLGWKVNFTLERSEIWNDEQLGFDLRRKNNQSNLQRFKGEIKCGRLLLPEKHSDLFQGKSEFQENATTTL